MAQAIARLTTLRVNNAGKGMHPDGAGLYLRVNPAGAKSWVYRYMLAGRAREMGLGPYPTFSLAEARQRATRARQQRHDGIDPIESRRAERAAAANGAAPAVTFKACAEQYIAAHQASWSNAK
ncbi:MAG TPA: Arm DNA-binding domain-containing protein, partial [Stellaceae bacterium]|nr:Arm DNA-binding domain-containing protein [Stellaceae bacterium]